MNTLSFDTPLGTLCAMEENECLVWLRFGECEVNTETPLLLSVKTQVLEYLDGKRSSFDIPLSLHGTEFQNRVWHALSQIPYGQRRTYSDIADAIGSPRACRAVGSACNKNPIAIIIPCHRVIGRNDTLVGYAYGIETKKYLLSLEKMY